MTRAFAACFIIGLILAWIALSIDHGKSFGKNIRETMKAFFNGKKDRQK